MSKEFKVNDRIFVSNDCEKYGGHVRGYSGTVKSKHDPNKLGVQLDGAYNNLSAKGLFWFEPDDICHIFEAKKSNEVKEDTMETNFEIKNVIFNDPATIVLWKDGTKTVVKCQEGDFYSEEMGLALCIAKKAMGNNGNFNNVFRKWIPEEGGEATGFDFVEAWRNFVKASLGIKSPSKEWWPDKDHDTFF